MKTTALLLGVLLVGSSLLSADTPKGPMLLVGDSHRDLNDLTLIAKRNAYAVIGNFRVAADLITYDYATRQLEAHGVTAISAGYSAMGARDITLKVDAENVYQMNPADIVINASPTELPDDHSSRGNVFTRAHRDTLPGSFTGSVAPATRPPTSFSKTLPKLQLNLRSIPAAPLR